MDVLGLRLRNQWLAEPAAASPAEVVGRLGAVQAQDYGGARWAVAQRGAGLRGADIDAALAEGAILRTHVLRPTWHLVTPADLRWMLALSAPRVKALLAYGNRGAGLDDATLTRSNRVIAAALRGGEHLTRAELREALGRAGIHPPDMTAVGRLTMAAELDGIVCSGALRGRQHTYARFDARVPPSAAADRETAVAELAVRYFAGHGPATVRDFSWWSGLSFTEAAAGVRSAGARLEAVEVPAATYWSTSETTAAGSEAGRTAHLLPNFDEYTVGYADRSLLIGDEPPHPLQARADVIANNVVIVDGRVAGTWRRSARTAEPRPLVMLSRRIDRPAQAQVAAAVERYATFASAATRLAEPGAERPSR